MAPEILSLFLLGMMSGASICTLSCLPYLAPYLMGTGNGFKGGVLASAVFFLGKCLCYSIFGGVAAYCGHEVQLESLSSSHLFAGLMLIIAASTIPFVSKLGGCGQSSCISIRKASLFGLGISSSLRPCPAMAAVLVLAAEKGSVSLGLAYGSVFGLGLSLSPLLLIGGGLSLISERIGVETGRLMPAIRVLSVVIMVIMGIRLMLLDV